MTTRGLTADKPGALTVRLRGYQWWWEFTYLDGRPDEVITTANELHIPVGRRVRILLDAPDVIHSFWVPSLAGKKDLIPGRDNEITIEADRPGTYRGQCAEYCGLQHAHMAFLVVADSPDAFAAWQDAQRKPVAEPVGDEAAEGLRRLSSKALRGVPYDPGDAGLRHARARPHPRGEPTVHRGRRIADHARFARRLDRRPANHQARKQHADGPAERGRTAGCLGLSSKPTMTSLDVAPETRDIQLAPEQGKLILAQTWSTPRGVWGALTTVDHKIIGLRYIITAFVFLALGGVLAMLMRLQLATT